VRDVARVIMSHEHACLFSSIIFVRITLDCSPFSTQNLLFQFIFQIKKIELLGDSNAGTTADFSQGRQNLILTNLSVFT
jgi:hypothetical protein